MNLRPPLLHSRNRFESELVRLDHQQLVLSGDGASVTHINERRFDYQIES